MKKILEGEIVNIQKECRDVYRLEFKSELEKITPGQFLSILCPPKILRRPFGITDFKDGVLTVLFKLRGEGTNYLKNLKIGDKISFNAPLGQGFKPNNKKSLIIGAGIGIAPLFYLNKKLKEQGTETKLICGFNTKEEIIQGCDFVKVGGTILNEIPKFIEEFKPVMLYCCAPLVVLKLASEIAQKYNLPIQVAMERTMACGIGVCRTCTIKIKTEKGIENRAICSDGPVFFGNEVVWE